MWDGRGIARNPELGTQLIRDAAKHGSANAWYFMGEAYLNERGVAQDPKAAFSWIEKAAQADNPFAEFQLDWIYLQGKGVARNIDLATTWLERAANDEISEANLDSASCTRAATSVRSTTGAPPATSGRPPWRAIKRQSDAMPASCATARV